MTQKAVITLLAFSLAGCFSSTNKPKQTEQTLLGEKNIRYYSDKTVTSLEVPPDLTKPNSQNALRLDDYVTGLEKNTVDFSKGSIQNTAKVAGSISGSTDVEVKRLGQIRWLVVDKTPEVVWNLARSFFKSYGFSIKKSDKKIGIMETNFLKNHPDVPDQSLGLIRSMLKKATGSTYTLPIIDKYRIRLEPLDGGKKTEVHFALNSMKEVVTDAGSEEENTIWQAYPTDELLETEMLYRFMVYLGSDGAVAREQIAEAQKKQITQVQVVTGAGGYTKLKFDLNKHDTWESIAWALDEMNVDVEDRDIKEGSFYVSVAQEKDKGILSGIFGEHAIKKMYQIIVKQTSGNTSEVTLNDLSDQNTQQTINFSRELLGNIAKKFQ